MEVEPWREKSRGTEAFWTERSEARRVSRPGGGGESTSSLRRPEGVARCDGASGREALGGELPSGTPAHGAASAGRSV